MNLNNLGIFVQVAEKMNMTEASKALFISQPAVSKAIQNLEASLQIRLFLRDKHNGLLLTEEGREILVLARQMKAIEASIYQIAGKANRLLSGKLKIGSFPAASAILLPQAIAAFRSEYPLVKIELIEGTSSQIKEWVENRTIELGIVTTPFEPYESETLSRDHMVAIVPDDHPLADEAVIDLKERRAEIIFCKGGHEIAVSAILREQGIELQESLTVQTAETLVRMVRSRLGIGLISSFTLSSVTHELAVKEIRPAIARKIGVIAHSFGELAPAAKQFLRFLTPAGNQTPGDPADEAASP